MSNIPEFEVGQGLFYVSNSSRNPNFSVTITKMGRKWAEITQVGRSRSDARFEFKAERWNRVDGGDYSSPGTLYLSEQDYEDKVKANKIGFLVGKKLQCSSPYSLQTMEKVAELLGIEVVE